MHTYVKFIVLKINICGTRNYKITTKHSLNGFTQFYYSCFSSSLNAQSGRSTAKVLFFTIYSSTFTLQLIPPEKVRKGKHQFCCLKCQFCLSRKTENIMVTNVFAICLLLLQNAFILEKYFTKKQIQEQ